MQDPETSEEKPVKPAGTLSARSKKALLGA